MARVVCPACRSIMVIVKDSEGRKWWRCPDCGAQLPVECQTKLIASFYPI